jgi:thiol-disulfide isomerase/thioredoxin
MLDLCFRRQCMRSCLLLVVLAALAGALAGCGAKSQPVADASTKFRPADEADAARADNGPSTDTAEPGAISRASSSANPTITTRSGRTPGGNTPPADMGSSKTPTDATAASSELTPILEQLDRLGRQQPKGNSQQEMIDDLVRTQTQRLALAKKALSLKPDKEIRQRIAMAMYEIHQFFIQARLPTAIAQLTDFGKTMAADVDEEIARIGRHAGFSAALARITSQPLENGKEIAAEAKKLLDAEQGKLSEPTLELVGQTADLMTREGFKNDAMTIIEALAAALANDPKLADQAPRYALVAKLVKADFDTLINDVIREQPGADAKLQTAVKTLLSDVPPSRDLLDRTRSVAQILEATGHYEAAQGCLDAIAVAFRNVTDERLADAKDLATKAQRRISLIGQPLKVEGVMPDGRPFDWSVYAGKVVLLDFWATWCGPCVEELPNIRRNFEQFHAKGFEVVGVNLNTNTADLKEFLALQEDLPWATVTSQEALDGKVKDADWNELPMAAKCGVDGIPFVVLIGKDGKVDSIHVRGAKLKQRLTQLLGEPITTEIPTDPTQPAAPPRAKSGAGKQSRLEAPRGGATPVALLLAQALFAADPPEPAASDDKAINPYRAKPDLTPAQLVAYIQKMLDRPQVIQTRAGFAEAIVEACDRILAVEPPATESEQLVAAESKFALLHREACDGNQAADKQLLAFALQMKDDNRPQIAREVAFFRLERRVLEAKELPLDQIPAIIKEVEEYASQEKLTAKHLRLASSTVAAINRLESGDEREAHFASLGSLLAKSSDKEVARYGKKLAKKPASEEEAPVSR